MHNNLLIIFIKNAIKGKVKTRLAKDIGDEKALEIYQQLLQHTHDITEKLEVNKEVFYSEYIEENDLWNKSNYSKKTQSGNGLGERMTVAFHEGFGSVNKSICIIGSDCYDLTAQVITEAFDKLKNYDFVIGPANDGGYYLLGMNQYFPQIFENKTYSTENVFQEAIDEIENLNKNYYILPELTDIDDINDLNKFQ